MEDLSVFCKEQLSVLRWKKEKEEEKNLKTRVEKRNKGGVNFLFLFAE